MIQINKNEKVFRKFKKAKNFDELNVVVKKENNYKSIEYKSNEKKVWNKDEKIKNLIVLNDQEEK